MTAAAENIAHGIDCHRAGRFEEAVASYRCALENDPALVDIWHLLGAAQHQVGDSRAAIESIGRAIELKPSDATYHNSLGVALRAVNEIAAAVARYRRALELSADFPDALNNLGVALRDCGELDEAIACYRRVLQLRPASPGTQSNLGIALMEQGDALFEQGNTIEAVAAYRDALQIKPDYADAQLNLGNALLRQGHVAEAAETYRRTIELHPHCAEAHNNLGSALLQQRKSEEAMACWRRALELKADYPEALCNVGVALSSEGKRDEAAGFYRRALELNPDSVEAYNNLGNVLRSLDRMDEAIECWRTALRLKPDCAEARTTLCMMLYGLKRTDEAAEVVREWMSVAPQDPVAQHMAAAFTGQAVPERASDDYIRSTFDHFAGTFEKQLQRLEYRAPELVAAATAAAMGAPRASLDVLDAGCGTGWCGPHVRPCARRLTGVDLSAAMIGQARDRGIYDDLVVAELTEYLTNHPGSFDLIISADTLVYFGNLQPVLAAAAQSLRPGGCLIFTLERGSDGYPPGQGFHLQHHGRYCHGEEYIRTTLDDAGLTVESLVLEVLRREMDEPVNGFLVTAVRPGETDGSGNSVIDTEYFKAGVLKKRRVPPIVSVAVSGFGVFSRPRWKSRNYSAREAIMALNSAWRDSNAAGIGSHR